jgi:hypothetical protein
MINYLELIRVKRNQKGKKRSWILFTQKERTTEKRRQTRRDERMNSSSLAAPPLAFGLSISSIDWIFTLQVWPRSVTRLPSSHLMHTFCHCLARQTWRRHIHSGMKFCEITPLECKQIREKKLSLHPRLLTTSRLSSDYLLAFFSSCCCCCLSHRNRRPRTGAWDL